MRAKLIQPSIAGLLLLSVNLGGLLLSQSVMAADFLSGDEIRATIVGNTITGVEDGESYTEYLNPNGTISGQSPSGKYSGNWRISDNEICFTYHEGRTKREAGKNKRDCNRVKLRGTQITWDDNSVATLVRHPLATAKPEIAARVPGIMPVKALPTKDVGEHVEAYTGLDVASHGWIFGWVEGTFAPLTNTDTSGLRIRLYGEAGDYQYHSETFAGASNKEMWYKGDLLVGYAFERQDFSAGLYLGAAVIDALLSSPDPNNPVKGTTVGPEVQGEFEWVHDKVLFSGEGFYTTAFNTYEAKLKLGGEIAPGVFVGPETAILGDERFNQWRVGAHLTALNIGKNLRMAIGGGYERDTDTGAGAYGTIQAGIEF